MKLHKYTLFAFISTALVAVSCQRHLVVPPPEPPVDQVEVECMFQGLVDTNNVLIQEDVNDYTCNMLVTKSILPSPQPSSAIYGDSLGSTSTAFLSGIRMDLGRFYWTHGGDDPTISEFENFFTGAHLESEFGDSVQIPLDNDALNGVQITWYDATGKPYYSRDTTTYPGTYFYFQNVVYAADNENEYVKWSAQFTIQMWHAPGDSVLIQNGLFTGAFKRKVQ